MVPISCAPCANPAADMLAVRSSVNFVSSEIDIRMLINGDVGPDNTFVTSTAWLRLAIGIISMSPKIFSYWET